ncbi:MAG: trypsin-like peptidase domain-containing protein [Proteobacteria bacterium]|nr:trypsin-like peptidase domain-containing protein [Pseudomonadota bacterium]
MRSRFEPAPSPLRRATAVVRFAAPGSARAAVSAAALAAVLAAVVVTAPSALARPVTPRGPLAADEQRTIDIFEKSKRSVVYISTSERVRDLWSRNVRTIPRGTGSGIIWDGAGHVITNYHVIAGASAATVRLNDGRDYPATLVGASQFHDIAVLAIRVPSNPPPALPLGTSHDLRVGQRVYAIGNPFGLDWTLTTGIVSALDRSIDDDNGNTIEHLIQTDAAINPGNSGGPLLDSAGRLIGMDTAIFSPSGASAGIGFAIPADTINRVVTALIEHGHYTRPALGIEMDADLNDLLSSRLGVAGVFVLRVAPRGPAAEAGLHAAKLERGSIVPGDVIVSVDGKPVTSPSRLQARLDDFNPGERVRLGVLRDGKEIAVTVTLGASR